MAIENARLLAAEAERTRALERTNVTLHHEITERQRVEAEREQLMAELEARHTEMEHMQTDMRHIHVAAATMQRLLDELLELSRIGHVANPFTEVPLSELAREAVTLVGGQIVARGAQVHITPNLPVVIRDRPRLLAVLQNLVDSAIKFMGTQPTPWIEVGARQEGEQTICYVQDNGVGIEPWYHEKVFGLFERLEVSSRGTGWGSPWSSGFLRCMAGASGSNLRGRGTAVRSASPCHSGGEGTQRTS